MVGIQPVGWPYAWDTAIRLAVWLGYSQEVGRMLGTQPVGWPYGWDTASRLAVCLGHSQ